MGYLVFCDVNQQGNIIESLIGKHVIPDRQYDCFFYTMDEGVMEDITLYKVDMETRELVLI